MSTTDPSACDSRDACLYVGALTLEPDDDASELALPALRRLVARAERDTVRVRDALAFVAWSAGVDEAALPVAALCRFGETGARDAQQWLRAEPVCLQPAQDTLHLYSAAAPADVDAEGAMLRAVAAHVADDGWELEVAAPRSWYLRAPDGLECTTTPPGRVPGGDVYAAMPGGPDGARVRSLINDVQMLIHADHAAVAPAVNTLWPWGEGRGDRVPARPDGAVAPAFSAHPLMQGLWRHWETPCVAPDGAAQALATGPAFVAMPALPRGRLGLEGLERDWLAPLLDALSRARVHAVTVVLGRGLRLRLDRRALRRLWRRPASLAATVATLTGTPS
ncbi:MAG: hypothetical protein AAGD86_08085 [Pseudomonadota bacterium]